MARILNTVLGVSRAMAMYGWYGGDIRRGFMVVHAFFVHCKEGSV